MASWRDEEGSDKNDVMLGNVGSEDDDDYDDEFGDDD